MVLQREFSFEDWLAALRRRRRLIIIPALLGAAAGYLLSRVLPVRYTSHTMVLVEEPVVPDNYVKPVVSEDLNQRLASMQGQILSRTRLQHLVEQFNLFKKDANRVPTELLVERLRKSIKVTPLNPMPGTLSQALPGFNVDVTLGEARLAQQTSTGITTMFLEQNLRAPPPRTEVTFPFLGHELEYAQAKAAHADAKARAFPRRYTS